MIIRPKKHHRLPDRKSTIDYQTPKHIPSIFRPKHYRLSDQKCTIEFQNNTNIDYQTKNTIDYRVQEQHRFSDKKYIVDQAKSTIGYQTKNAPSIIRPKKHHRLIIRIKKATWIVRPEKTPSLSDQTSIIDYQTKKAPSIIRPKKAPSII